jgi:hypothetical protein|mmetsp:Transcript_13874/g.16761  ORF Transcript_13874/g.16761 Transcript_13874/m.16761 type:complete len:90 (+) Transcript_13874:358-627(+)
MCCVCLIDWHCFSAILLLDKKLFEKSTLVCYKVHEAEELAKANLNQLNLQDYPGQNEAPEEPKRWALGADIGHLFIGILMTSLVEGGPR